MKGILLLFSIACVCLLASCQKATPRDTFNAAVLNTNLMHGFAGEGMRSQLSQAGTKLSGPNFDQEVEMKRMEVVATKLTALEEAFEKLKKLKPDDDSRAMLQAATALYEFVLPVYRNEYRQLAGLYDDKADAAKIQALEQSIQDQYQAKFAALSAALTAAAKPYAEKNQIQVTWDVQTSPSR